MIFDPQKTVTLSTDTLHENVDWTLYAGLEVQGWPTTTLSHGKVIVNDGQFLGAAGNGRFVPRFFN